MLALGTLLGLFLWGTYREEKGRNHEELEKCLGVVGDLFAARLEEDANMMCAASGVLEKDELLRDAFIRRDREALLKRARLHFDSLLEENRVTHFYFTDPNRVNFLRVHQPDRHGDTIERFTMLKAERTGKSAWGIELGPMGTFTLRAVHPWYDGDQLIGYIELGEEINHVIDGLRSTLDVDLYPSVCKKYLDRRQWEAGMRMLGHNSDWDLMGDCVTISPEPVPEGLSEIHARRCGGEKTFDYHLDTADRQTRVGFLPLVNAGGRTVGEMAVRMDVTDRQTAAGQKMFTAALACLMVGSVLFVVFYILLGRVERDLAAARRRAVDESRSREEAQAEHTEAIRAHRDRLQAVMDGIPSPLMVIGRDYKISVANRAVRELAGGIDPAEHGLTCHHVSHHRDTPCEGPNDPCPLKQAIQTGTPVRMTHVHFDAQQRESTVDITATPVFDGNGEVTQIIESCYDVTDRVRTLEAVRLQSSALESAANAIVITDRKGCITWINPAFAQLTGYPIEEATDRNPRILKSGKHDEAFYKNLWQTILAGNVWHGELINRRRNGTLFTTETTITPVLDEEGEIGHFVAVLQDVTERKRTETELENATRAAEAANRAKSDFLANMSHEIRTPMTAILGFSDMLLDTDQTEAQRSEAVETIRKNGKHLLTLINDILDLSKVEAGKMNCENIPCPPLHLLSEIETLMRDRADAKGLEFRVDCVGIIPEVIETDPTRLRQILINLVGNAIKFTDSGNVRLVAQFIGGDHPKMQFDVSDTGIGITPEQAEGLFRPFAQADSSTARQFGGTGLGLALSKQFAGMLGGSIVLADTQTGVGSRFQVTVAARLPDDTRVIDGSTEATAPIASDSPVGLKTEESICPAECTSTEGEPCPCCRVLVAEDGPDNQRIMSFFIEKAGGEVTVVDNGRLAVDAALAARDEGRPFSTILMDMQMPVMDGYEATTLLRQEGYTGIIIAVTAHAMAEDRRTCLTVGCDDYVSKPIDRAELIETVQKYLPAPSETEDCCGRS